MSDNQSEIGSDGKKVPLTTDPACWAATFVRIIRGSHKMELPVASMQTWFERCLKAGFQDAIETFLATQTRVYGCINDDQIRQKFSKPPVLSKVGRHKRFFPKRGKESFASAGPNSKFARNRKAAREGRPLLDTTIPEKVDGWGHKT